MNILRLNTLNDDKVIVKKEGGNGGGNNKIVYDANSQEDLKALYDLIMSMTPIDGNGTVIFEDVVVLINYRDSRYVLYKSDTGTLTAFYDTRTIYIGNLEKNGDEYSIKRYE